MNLTFKEAKKWWARQGVDVRGTKRWDDLDPRIIAWKKSQAVSKK